MAVAHSIFTLGGWVQLFWTALYMPVTGVPLEVGLGWQKFYFGAFQKIIIQWVSSDFFQLFFEMPKNQICPILMPILMVPLSWAYQKLPKTIEPPI